MTEKTRIKISPSKLQQVRDLLNDHKKIGAIKLLRREGKAWPGSTIEEPDSDGNVVTRIDHGVSLRDAKEAVEVLMGTRLAQEACGIIAPSVRIKKIIIEGSHGDIEMDLDQLQLRLLDGLGIIPMEEISAMTELMAFLREWSQS